MVQRDEDAAMILTARARLFVEFGFDRLTVAMMSDEDVAYELLNARCDKTEMIIKAMREDCE